MTKTKRYVGTAAIGSVMLVLGLAVGFAVADRCNRALMVAAAVEQAGLQAAANEMPVRSGLNDDQILELSIQTNQTEVLTAGLLGRGSEVNTGRLPYFAFLDESRIANDTLLSPLGRPYVLRIVYRYAARQASPEPTVLVELDTALVPTKRASGVRP